jgi:hypothetical protein
VGNVFFKGPHFIGTSGSGGNKGERELHWYDTGDFVEGNGRVSS